MQENTQTQTKQKEGKDDIPLSTLVYVFQNAAGFQPSMNASGIELSRAYFMRHSANGNFVPLSFNEFQKLNAQNRARLYKGFTAKTANGELPIIINKEFTKNGRANGTKYTELSALVYIHTQKYIIEQKRYISQTIQQLIPITNPITWDNENKVYTGGIVDSRLKLLCCDCTATGLKIDKHNRVEAAIFQCILNSLPLIHNLMPYATDYEDMQAKIAANAYFTLFNAWQEAQTRYFEESINGKSFDIMLFVKNAANNLPDDAKTVYNRAYNAMRKRADDSLVTKALMLSSAIDSLARLEKLQEIALTGKPQNFGKSRDELTKELIAVQNNKNAAILPYNRRYNAVINRINNIEFLHTCKRAKKIKIKRDSAGKTLIINPHEKNIVRFNRELSRFMARYEGIKRAIMGIDDTLTMKVYNKKVNTKQYRLNLLESHKIAKINSIIHLLPTTGREVYAKNAKTRRINAINAVYHGKISKIEDRFNKKISYIESEIGKSRLVASANATNNELSAAIRAKKIVEYKQLINRLLPAFS